MRETAKRRGRGLLAWILSLAMTISGVFVLPGAAAVYGADTALTEGERYTVSLSEGEYGDGTYTYVGEIAGYTYADQAAAEAGTRTDGTRELLVSDQVYTGMSWDSLNSRDLIYGDYDNPLTVTVNGASYYAAMRSLTAGSASANRAQDGVRLGTGLENNAGLPDGNEWDVIVSKSYESGAGTANDSCYIKNWDGTVSFAQDIHESGDVAVRGLTARGWNRCPADYAVGTYGFRPVLELLGPAAEPPVEGLPTEEPPEADQGQPPLEVNGAVGDILTYTIPSGQDNAGEPLYFRMNAGETSVTLVNDVTGTEDGTSAYTAYSGALTIPASVSGYSVTGIGTNVFSGCASLTDLYVSADLALTEAEIQSGCGAAVHRDANGGDVQPMPSFSGGAGTEAEPYQIASAEDFNTMAQTVSGGETYAGTYFRQTADLDFTNVTYSGITSTLFGGIYDGGGFAIKNLSSSGALFGSTSGAAIRNMVLTNTCTFSNRGVSSMIATMRGGILENCDVSARVQGVASDTNYFSSGGLVITATDNAVIRDCVYSGTISPGRGWCDYIAGIANSIQNGTVVERCVMKGNIISTPAGESGIVYGQGADTLIKDCYNLSALTDNGGRGSAGIAVSSNGKIENSYSAARTKSGNGLVNSGSPTMLNCYYNNEFNSTGVASSADVEGQYEGRTTVELKSWDMVTLLNGSRLGAQRVWTLGTDSYPTLDIDQLEPVSVESVTIAGRRAIGSVLAAEALAPTEATVLYQWQKADSASGDFTNIEGATAAGYTITAEDTDQYIRLIVTGVGNFKDSAASNALRVMPSFGGGSGTKEAPYQITSAADFNAMAEIVSSGETCVGTYFEQKADLDFTNVTYGGITSTLFGGTYDGGGFAIKNLTCSGPLFGSTSGAAIRNMVLANTCTFSDRGVSSMIATMTGGILESCDVSARVQGQAVDTNYFNSGGLVIIATDNAVIRDCVYSGTISPGRGWCDYIAGIANSIQNGTVVERCVMKGNIPNTPAGESGIVYRQGADTLIKDCYNLSALTDNGGRGSAGIAVSSDGKIENCYSPVKTKSGNGLVNSGSPTMLNCYYNNELNSTGVASNADVEGQYEGRTTAELKSWATVIALNGSRAGTERVWTLAAADSYPSLDTNQSEKDELRGTVTVSGDYKVGSTLTADVTGVLPAAATFTYQWQESTDNSTWNDIQAEAQSGSFTITSSQAGNYVRLQLVGAGTFSGTLASETTAAVGNGSQNAPEKAAAKSKTDTTIEVNATAGVEYAVNTSNTAAPTEGYNASGSFTGLTRNTTYYVWARTAAKPGYDASAAVVSDAISTNKTDVTGVTISGTAKVDQTLTAAVEPSEATATYQWYRGSEAISGATNATYKLTTADAGQKVKVTATGSGDFQGSVTSAETAAVANAGQNVPAIPTASAKTDTTITMNAVAGQEYAASNDNTTAPTTGYIANGSFTGLTRNTTYYVWTRVAAKPGYDASDAVVSAAIVTEQTAIGGTVGISGMTNVGQTLTADVSGVTPADATLSYVWKRGAAVISGETSSSYVTTAADAAREITVTVTGTGDFTGELSSAAVTIGKTTQDAPIGLTAQSPATAGGSDGKITGLTAEKKYEYKLSTAEDYTAAAAGSTEITGLTAGVYHVRYAENETMNPSDPATVTISDGKTVLAGVVSIDGTARFGETLTANVSGVTPTDATYELAWYREGEAVATGSAYTLTAGDIRKVITLKAAGTDTFTGELSAATEVVGKAAGSTEQPAKPALAENGVTDTTVALTTVSGQEYRQGTTGEWQESGLFEGLTTGTQYEFYTRVAATETQESGAVSEALTVTTLGYGITLDKEGVVILTPATVGYENAASTTVTVTNTGTGTVTGLSAALSGDGAANFTVSSVSPASIGVSQTAVFTVTPKAGLAVGTYSAIVTVSGGKGVSGSFSVSFAVAEKPVGVAVSGYVEKGRSVTLALMQGEAVVTTTAAIDGQFLFDTVESGNYSLRISAPSALTRTIDIVVGDTDYEVSTSEKVIDLIYGDADQSGSVGAPDLALVKANYSAQRGDAKYIEAADADNSGSIGAPDLALVKRNFSKTVTDYAVWSNQAE